MRNKITIRTGCHDYEIDILESLWDAVRRYCKQVGINRSHLFEKLGRQLLTNPLPIPYFPERRVVPYTKTMDFKSEFPTIRTTLSIDSALLGKLYNILNEVAKKQYRTWKEVDITIVAETVFYHFCREHNLDVQWDYFSDDYFNRHYYSDREYILEKLKVLSRILGRSPTAMDWVEHRKVVEGPSLSFVKKQFGSFNKAKSEAGLFLETWGKRK